MTNRTSRNTAESESGQAVEPALPALPAEDEMRSSGGKSRRDALATLAKHTAYKAPAVLTILSLSTKRVKAGFF